MTIDDKTFVALKEACEAAIRYDNSIAGRAIRDEIDLRDGIASSKGEDLDELYADWQGKSRKALQLIEGVDV